MTEVSFIIPSRNSHKTIGHTLKSIFCQKSFDRVNDVIVVDSSNDEKTRTVLKEFNHDQLKIILVPAKRTTPASVRNMGAQYAAGDLLCFIDSDVYLDETWLDQILEARANGCRAGAGGVGASHFQNESILALAQLYLQFNESLGTGKTRPAAMVPACNMFVERKLFDRIGGFPDIRAAEDVLLCLKLGKITGIYLVPAARCFHIFRDDFRAYFNNQKILGKYIIIYRRMICGKWYYKGPWPVVMLPAFVLIKTGRIASRVRHCGREHFKKFCLSSPLFLAGLFFWAVGFAQGCFPGSRDENLKNQYL